MTEVSFWVEYPFKTSEATWQMLVHRWGKLDRVSKTVNVVKHKILIQYLFFIFSRPSKTLPGVMISLQMILWHWSMRGLMLIMKVRAARSWYIHTVSFGVWLGKARQVYLY